MLEFRIWGFRGSGVEDLQGFSGFVLQVWFFHFGACVVDVRIWGLGFRVWSLGF